MHAMGGWSLQTDFIRVTGKTDATKLARWLAEIEPMAFAWEVGTSTRRYAASLIASDGVLLQYGRRNADGLDCPQSDTRDSQEFVLEVPGALSARVLESLRQHSDASGFQCARRDVCATFKPKDPGHVYEMFSDLVLHEFGRPADHKGPRNEPWQSVSLATHEKQCMAPRYAILYDKHAKSPDEFPEVGTLRLEFRWQPEKKAQKQIAFFATDDELVNSWRFARNTLEVMAGVPREKSFTWLQKNPEAEFFAKFQALVHSYGPTIFRGINKHGNAFMQALAWASIIQAEHQEFAKELPSVETMDS